MKENSNKMKEQHNIYTHEEKPITKGGRWGLGISIFVLFALVIFGYVAVVLIVKDAMKMVNLYSDTLNNATFKSSSEMQLLYSYPITSGPGGNSGFFTITVDGNFDIPNIKYEVRDQTNRVITTGRTVVGKVTNVNFSGTSRSKTIDLYVQPKGSNINLQNLSINVKNNLSFF